MINFTHRTLENVQQRRKEKKRKECEREDKCYGNTVLSGGRCKMINSILTVLRVKRFVWRFRWAFHCVFRRFGEDFDGEKNFYLGWKVSRPWKNVRSILSKKHQLGWQTMVSESVKNIVKLRFVISDKAMTVSIRWKQTMAQRELVNDPFHLIT